MAVKIETFRISRLEGRSENWAQLNLLRGQQEAINQIGATHYQTLPLSTEEFLNTYVALPKETYKVETLDENKLQKTDKLLVIRVTI